MTNITEEEKQSMERVAQELDRISLHDITEKAYINAIKMVAEQTVAMVREDNDSIEDQRGEVGNYLAAAVKDIQAEIEKLLDK